MTTADHGFDLAATDNGVAGVLNLEAELERIPALDDIVIVASVETTDTGMGPTWTPTSPADRRQCDVDAVSASVGAETVAWYETDGSLSFTERTIVDSAGRGGAEPYLRNYEPASRVLAVVAGRRSHFESRRFGGSGDWRVSPGLARYAKTKTRPRFVQLPWS